jgi:hypothetical protein
LLSLLSLGIFAGSLFGSSSFDGFTTDSLVLGFLLPLALELGSLLLGYALLLG